MAGIVAVDDTPRMEKVRTVPYLLLVLAYFLLFLPSIFPSWFIK